VRCGGGNGRREEEGEAEKGKKGKPRGFLFSLLATGIALTFKGKPGNNFDGIGWDGMELD